MVLGSLGGLAGSGHEILSKMAALRQPDPKRTLYRTPPQQTPMIRPRMQALARTLAVTAALTAAMAAQTPYDALLTVADVTKLTGISGVKTVPNGSQVGAGGMLNFARADGKLVLMVNFGDAQLYRKARDTKELVSTYYPGVGEQVRPVLTEAQLNTIAQLIFSRE
jgi:hypothetical protein